MANVAYPNWNPGFINREFTHKASENQFIGDLCYWDSNNSVVRPASAITDAGSGTTEQNFAAVFLGVLNSRQLSTDSTARQAAIIIDGVWEFPCVSNTFAPGDLVAPTYSSGLLSQSVSKTTNALAAIGRVIHNYASAVTKVKVRLTSKMLVGLNRTIGTGSLTADDITGTDASLGITGKAGSSGAGGIVAIAGGAGDTGAGGAVTVTGGLGSAAAGGALTMAGGGGGTNSAGGAVSYTGGAGAGTGAGGAATLAGGVGGGGATGNGGQANVTGGAATSTAGTGGAVVLTGGVGTTTGLGGAITGTSGAGGNASAGGTGAAGGVITWTTGAGGTTATGTGGASGAATLASGVGGNASGAGTGGAGGAVAITGGAGGTTTSSTGGAGSTVTITAGAGGTASGAGTGGAGGNVNLQPGAGGGTSGGTAGAAGSVLFAGKGYNVQSPAVSAATNTTIFVATRACKVVGCSCLFNATAGGASTLNITKETTTGGPGSGTTILNANFNLNATGNTIQNGALTTGSAVTLAAGDRISTSFNNSIQSSTGVVVALEIAMQ